MALIDRQKIAAAARSSASQPAWAGAPCADEPCADQPWDSLERAVKRVFASEDARYRAVLAAELAAGLAADLAAGLASGLASGLAAHAGRADPAAEAAVEQAYAAVDTALRELASLVRTSRLGAEAIRRHFATHGYDTRAMIDDALGD